MIELALNWVAQKHNLLLDPKYKLPRRDYFGSSGPEAQYVRSEPKCVRRTPAPEAFTLAPIAFHLMCNTSCARLWAATEVVPTE